MEHIRESGAGSKREIRKAILTVRDRISPTDKMHWDIRIRNRVLLHPAYRDAKVILAYASCRSEVDTMGLIGQALEDGKYVFAPRVSGEEMEFWQIMSPEELRSGYRGIPEPVRNISLAKWAEGAHECSACKAMMWMPGAAFDRDRSRIGYGKGFYDRYLDRFAKRNGQLFLQEGVSFDLVTAALAYSCQIVQCIPCEPHDVRPDIIITEKEVLQGRA